MATHTVTFPESTAKITFNCTFRSKPRDSAADRIKTALKGVLSADEVNPLVIDMFAYMLACTKSVELSIGEETPTDAFSDLQEFVIWATENFYIADAKLVRFADVVNDDAVILECWFKFQALVAPDLQEEWVAAFVKGQQIMPGKRHLLPKELLTEAELKDEDFLAGKKPL